MSSLSELRIRERLIEVRDEYQQRGYNVKVKPLLEDVPDFARSIQPDMIAYRENESIIVKVKSRDTLDTSLADQVQRLTQNIKKYPGWHVEIVVANSGRTGDIEFPQKTIPLQKEEIGTNLGLVRSFLTQSSGAALLFCWSLTEASLRLLAQREAVELGEPISSRYIIKKLTVEGVISREQSTRLMEFLALRNAIAHGFKTPEASEEIVLELIKLTENLI